jgi:hypothetical protein
MSFVFKPLFLGMADRILGFTSVFVFAMLSNRIFQIGKRFPLPDMEEVFVSPNINWSRSDSAEPDWIIEPLQHKAKARNYNSSILETKKYYAVNTIDDWKLQDKFLRQDISQILGKEFQTTFIAMNRGKTIRVFENTHYQKQLAETGMNPSNCFGCVVEFLIQPKPSVFLSVYNEFLLMRDLTASYYASYSSSPLIEEDKKKMKKNTLVIAIQIRTGDENLSNEQHTLQLSSYSAFFSCAKQIEDFVLHGSSSSSSSAAEDPLTKVSYTQAKWFLVTDSLPLRKLALQEYGSDKLITNIQTKIEHSSKESSVCKEKPAPVSCAVSKEGFATAAAEWWLMSYARYHVITGYSGYGRSAAMHSLYPNSIYTVNNGKFNAALTCNNQSFTDLETLSYDWSGV